MYDGVVFFKTRLVFFFQHKTAYEMRISDWSSDVCSSDLVATLALQVTGNSFNIIVLAGLVMALVVVVDEAIVDLDNLMRRRRNNLAEGTYEPGERSEERRVGKECVSRCGSRWSSSVKKQ